MLNEYIIVTTFCNKEAIANKIINTLLNKKLVAGTQISKVHSKYWWNNELEECDEYRGQSLEQQKRLSTWQNRS